MTFTDFSLMSYTKSIEQDADILNLVSEIRTNEHGTPHGALFDLDLRDIQGYYQSSKGNFWLCYWKQTLVGTVGLVASESGCKTFVLRKMFVRSEFRGAKYAIATQLLKLCIDHSLANDINTIVLGTNRTYVAANRFYRKNDFHEIPREEFPSDHANKLDDVFYRLNIQRSYNVSENKTIH